MKTPTEAQRQRQKVRNKDGTYAETTHAEADVDLGLSAEAQGETEPTLTSVLREIDVDDADVAGFNVRYGELADADAVNASVKRIVNTIADIDDEDLQREETLRLADDLEAETGYGDFATAADSASASWSAALRSLVVTGRADGIWDDQETFYDEAASTDPYQAADAAKRALVSERLTRRTRRFSDAESLFVAMNLSSESTMASIAADARDDAGDDPRLFGLKVMQRACSVPDSYRPTDPTDI